MRSFPPIILWRNRKSVSLKELGDEPFILPPICPILGTISSVCFVLLALEPRIVFRSRSQELIRGLVAHGHGFAIQNAIPATTIAY